jgi:hypothetical protein
MKVNPKSVKRNVNLLTDPTPTYLSDVDHGANQAPWKSLKSHTGKGSDDMAIKTQGSKTPVVRSLAMSKDVYKTEAAVAKYLTEKGWDKDSYEVFDDDSGEWLVKSTDEYEDGALSKPRSVATKDAGVIAFVSEVIKTAEKVEEADDSEDDDEEEETEKAVEGQNGLPATTDDTDEGAANNLAKNPAAGVQRASGKKLAKVKRVILPEVEGDSDNVSKADRVIAYRTSELAAKYDWYSAYMSDDSTLMGVIKEGMNYDDLPPGIETVMDAVYCTAGNILGDSTVTDKSAALKALGNDFAEITMGLYSLFTKAATDLGDEAQKFAQSFKDSVSKARKASFSAESDGGETVERADEGEEKGEKSTKSAAPAVAAPKGLTVEDVAAAVSKAVAPLQTQLAASNAEIKKLQGTGQARKGLAGVFDDMVDQETEKTSSQKQEDQLSIARGLMGGRPVQRSDQRH